MENPYGIAIVNDIPDSGMKSTMKLRIRRMEIE